VVKIKNINTFSTNSKMIIAPYNTNNVQYFVKIVNWKVEKNAEGFVTRPNPGGNYFTECYIMKKR
jgi:hypothetical protein